MTRLLGLLFSLVYASGLGLLFFRLARPQVRVLMYHGVCADDGPQAPFGGRGKHVRAALFRQQLAWLRRHARILSIDELLDLLEQRLPPPRRAVVVTLDDGYRNNYEHAWPVLMEEAVPAAVYVTTSFVEGEPLWFDRVDHAMEQTGATTISLPVAGIDLPCGTDAERRRVAALVRVAGKRLAGSQRDELVRELVVATGEDLVALSEGERPADVRAMTPEMIRQLSVSGTTVGSHTVHHEILSHCDAEELAAELVHPRARLQEWTGMDATHFAYPNGARGDFDDGTEEAVRRAGYRSALLTVRGTVRGGESAWRIPRLPVNAGEGMAEFVADLCGLRSLLLALRERVRRAR